jgi:hypothetical protein
MLNSAQQNHIARTCTNALSSAIGSFGKLLEESDSEAAAAIVADLIKACMGLTPPEPNPADALAKIIQLAHQEAGAAQQTEGSY